MNKKELICLGFSKDEIDIALCILDMNDSKIRNSVNAICDIYRLEYSVAERVKYLIDIILGKRIINIHNIEEIQDLKKIANHFRKMNRGENKYISKNLPGSIVTNIPKIAIVAGIKDEAFLALNSKRAIDRESYYKIFSINSNNALIIVSKNKKINANKGNNSNIRVAGKNTRGDYVIEISRSNIKLCNRYIIVISLRAPIKSIGGYALVSCGSTEVVYVYAKKIGPNETYINTYRERVYDWGIIGEDIHKKIKNVIRKVYMGNSIIFSVRINPSDSYQVIERSNNMCNSSSLII